MWAGEVYNHHQTPPPKHLVWVGAHDGHPPVCQYLLSWSALLLLLLL
jgi:hypothetical protein